MFYILRKELLCCFLFSSFFLFVFLFLHTCSKGEGSVGLVKGPAGLGPSSTPHSILHSQRPIIIKADSADTAPHRHLDWKVRANLLDKKGLTKKKKI